MNTTENANAKCPFYISCKGQSITCEYGGDIITVHFKANGQDSARRLRLSHMSRYCFSVRECRACPIYKIAYARWI